jgi:hypothetical protein
LPRIEGALFPGGWEQAMERNISFIVNRMNERVIAGQSIETLLAVLMFVLMGITLERSKIAEDLLTTMARVFGPLPGGLAVSIVIVGAFLAASTGIVGATVVTMGLLALPTMLRNNYSPELATGVIAASGTLGQIIPPSIVIVLLGTLVGDLYATGQETRAQLAGCSDALTYLGQPAVLSVGTLFQAALLPGDLPGGALCRLRLRLRAGEPVQGAAGGDWRASSSEPVTRNEALTWFLGCPRPPDRGQCRRGGGLVGSQTIFLTDASPRARAQPADQCQRAVPGRDDRVARAGSLGRRRGRTRRRIRRCRRRGGRRCRRPHARRHDRGRDRRTAREGRGRGRPDRHRRGDDLHAAGADPCHGARRFAGVEPDAADRGRGGRRAGLHLRHRCSSTR